MSNPNILNSNGIKIENSSESIQLSMLNDNNELGLTIKYGINSLNINSNGFTYNNGTNTYNTSNEKISLISTALSSIELPDDINELKINNKLVINDGISSSNITFDGDLVINSDNNIILNNKTTYNETITDNTEITNKSYVDNKINTEISNAITNINNYNYYSDDLWGTGGLLQITTSGTHATNSPTIQTSELNHNGIIRFFNASSNSVAGYEMSSTINLDSIPLNKPLHIIIRPWPTGTIGNTTIKFGLSGSLGSTSPSSGIFWRYSTNISPVNVWNLVINNVSVYSISNPSQYVNDWLKMVLLRTSNNDFTVSLINLTTNETFTTNQTISNTNINLYCGAIVSCVSGGVNKYCDIDRISFYLNNN